MNKRENGFSPVTIVLAIMILGVGIAGWYVLRSQGKNQATETSVGPQTQMERGNLAANFATPKKGAHFETSTPAHSSTLVAVPADVVIDFNFDLASNSTIKIEKDGKDYGLAETKIDSNKLAMRRHMDKNSPDGVYTVNYNGCWPDRTCHDGHFQFAINKNLVNTYDDKRNQQSITVNMSEIKFKPMNVRISPGTSVTWVNDDDAEHYVNTDSHPAHTHVPGLNSRVLAKGASYSFTFSDPGAYPYHCSAHASDMTGTIVVE